MLLTSRDLLSNEPRMLNNSSNNKQLQTSTEDHLKGNSKFHSNNNNSNSKALPNSGT
jgi:hypothetical protein